jgi:hypothetical protein
VKQTPQCSTKNFGRHELYCRRRRDGYSRSRRWLVGSNAQITHRVHFGCAEYQELVRHLLFNCFLFLEYLGLRYTGEGKTVIFSSVIDEISATLPHAQVVYFYCKNNEPLRSHFTDIAKSLISQILQINPNCLDFIYKSMLAGGERRAKDPSKLLQILGQILTYHDSLYIGIDGLDECPEEERKLFSNLIAIGSKANDEGNVRIIVTSRQEKDLEKSLKAATKFNIKSHDLENDITTYIRFKMAQLCQRFKFTQEKEQIISKEICTRPMGNPPS